MSRWYTYRYSLYCMVKDKQEKVWGPCVQDGGNWFSVSQTGQLIDGKNIAQIKYISCKEFDKIIKGE